MLVPEDVAAFLDAATKYCDWAEGPAAEADDEAATAVRLLSAILHHMQTLPGAESEGLSEHEILQKGPETVRIYKRFAALPFQYYSEVWDPLEVPGAEPVTGDIADDLMDIYIDLKQGLIYAGQQRIGEAVFYWGFTYGVHWGRHATSALRVLHCHLVDPKGWAEQP